MIDKVIVVNKNQAYVIYQDDREPFGIYSDVDVAPLILWLFGDSHTVLTPQNTIEFRRDATDEITVSIPDGD